MNVLPRESLKSVVTIARRGVLRPPKNTPYYGLYRTEGDVARQDDLLVSQKRFNYHPGANVYYVADRDCHLIKAACDGTVMITREHAEVDMTQPAMQFHYAHRVPTQLYKLTYNVVPFPPSNRFALVDEV